MRIVIDMQGAQTGSAKRGIGRYTVEFVKAILREKNDRHEVIVALNGLFGETIEPIRQSLKGLLSDSDIVVWNAIEPAFHGDSSNYWRRRTSELIRVSFLASLNPDFVIVTSLFEGFNENAIGTINPSFLRMPTAVILYDLIPYRYPNLYIGTESAANWYSDKVANFKNADLWLSISESAKQEAIELLNLDKDKVANISTAVDERFDKQEKDVDATNNFLQTHSIIGRFLLSTGGAETRKNIRRLIEAFSLLPTDLRKKYQLVLYGCSKTEDKVLIEAWTREYHIPSDRVVILSHVSDSDLIALYNSCEMFIFPSWHEGFGLPVLEAMKCGAPTIAANATSVPEVVGWDAALFNPHNAEEISNKILEVLTDNRFREQLIIHAEKQAQSFSWSKTALAAIGALEAAYKPWPQKDYFTKQYLYTNLIQAIGGISHDIACPSDEDVLSCANAIAHNQTLAAKFTRGTRLPEQLTWRIEGPFDSSYSLALLNRETARALGRAGHKVILHSTEGPGDFPADENFLAKNPDLAVLYHRSGSVSQEQSDVVSRNLYPPRVADMCGKFNLLHHFAWEESGFPYSWVNDFNMFLDGATCLSTHVMKSLIDNGVTIPLSVSGCGVDHWENIIPDSSYPVSGKKFKFLHVSSCFPRKGANLLLKAYGEAFSAADDVCLIIKTFANPHNEIHKWLNEAKEGRHDYPDVTVIEDDLSESALKFLYEQCDALVAPSMAEGFGLPIAEAMLSGLSVITTAWGGQLDFCRPEFAWLIDYDFEPAQTHLELFDSVWARPKVLELSAAMREVHQLPVTEREKRVALGREFLMENFKWDDVCERLVRSAKSFSSSEGVKSSNIGWVSTWNARCGIATYSEHLVNNMVSDVTLFAPNNQEKISDDQKNVVRVWENGVADDLTLLSEEVLGSGIDALVIQFNYYFYEFSYLEKFIQRVVANDIPVVIVLHSTTDPKNDAGGWVENKRLASLRSTLSCVDRILVHSVPDLNRLKAIGLVNNVALFPHGILNFTADTTQSNENYFVVASYGFFLPNKGLIELIKAVAVLHNQGIKIKLKLINAEYSAKESAAIIDDARKLIADYNIGDIVEMETDFLADAESLNRLSAADLIVFPYQNTGESASGAVRYGLASGKPVAVTPLAIFDDVSSVTFELPGCGVHDIADGIARIRNLILEKSEDYVELMNNADRWRESHRYTVLGDRLDNLLSALVRQRRHSSYH